jgi:fumarate hydratase subunit beta
MKELSMPAHRRLTVPFPREIALSLNAGDPVLLSGTIYTARDAAHQRLCEALTKGQPSPVPLDGQLIYYVGPTPPKPGEPIGSAGPTTAVRMDSYMELLFQRGLLATMGKGQRSEACVELHKKYQRVYFLTIGGAGAVLGKKIKAARVLAYEDLGPEAIRELAVEDFPAVCCIDARGVDACVVGRAKYARPVA